VRGPATVPSLVTCPISATQVEPAFATSASRVATSRTCPTLPAGPPSSAEANVWTLSTTANAGADASIAQPPSRGPLSRRGPPRRPRPRPARRVRGPGRPTPRRSGRASRVRLRPGVRRAAGGASTCRSPDRRRRGRSSRGRGRRPGRGRAHRSRSAGADASALLDPPMGEMAPSLRRARSRLAPTRLRPMRRA
jgi:hypothetical protein